MLGRLLSGKAIGTDELVVRDTKFLDADENIDWEKWAPNGGRVPGTIKENQTIPAGTIIDRYGSQWGKYTSPAGVPYEQRALPYIENPNAYHKYEVLKPIDNVTISEIAPAFEQVGGGIQYELPNNIKKLKEIIYVFLTIFLYLLKCPQSLILSALRAFCLCGKPHISRLIFLYFPCQSWLKSW